MRFEDHDSRDAISREIIDRQTNRSVKWIRLAVGVALLAAFFIFLTTKPHPPGLAGEMIERNLQQDVQATALFYTDLNTMPEIEARLIADRARPPQKKQDKVNTR